LVKSIAAEAGLRPGILIAEINGQCTCCLDHVQRMRLLRRTCASIGVHGHNSILNIGLQKRLGILVNRNQGEIFLHDANQYDNGSGTVSVLQAIRAGIKRSQNSLHRDHVDSINVTTKHILESIKKAVELVVMKSFEAPELHITEEFARPLIEAIEKLLAHGILPTGKHAKGPQYENPLFCL
jgi:hypothetical protein